MSKRPFNFAEILGELATSGFVGIITFLMCDLANFPPLMNAALVGISGHMGSRALRLAWMMGTGHGHDPP